MKKAMFMMFVLVLLMSVTGCKEEPEQKWDPQPEQITCQVLAREYLPDSMGDASYAIGADGKGVIVPGTYTPEKFIVLLLINGETVSFDNKDFWSKTEGQKSLVITRQKSRSWLVDYEYYYDGKLL